jgi:predicted site-specific integrase-resolvase
MPRDTDTPWYTREEAAQYLRMSVDTLDRWQRDGVVERHTASNGRPRYHQDSLDAALRLHPEVIEP